MFSQWARNNEGMYLTVMKLDVKEQEPDRTSMKNGKTTNGRTRVCVKIWLYPIGPRSLLRNLGNLHSISKFFWRIGRNHKNTFAQDRITESVHMNHYTFTILTAMSLRNNWIAESDWQRDRVRSRTHEPYRTCNVPGHPTIHLTGKTLSCAGNARTIMMAAVHLTSNRWKLVTVVRRTLWLQDLLLYRKDQINLFAGNSTGFLTVLLTRSSLIKRIV